MKKHDKEDKEAKYGPTSRREMEQHEGDNQSTGFDNSRMQSSVQTNTTSENITKPEDSDLSTVRKAAMDIRDDIKVRPAAGVSDRKTPPVAGGTVDTYSATTFSAAGQGAAPVSDQSLIPYNRGGNRPNQSYARKTSLDDSVIDNACSEQISPSFEEPLGLAEASDEVMFYNGRKKWDIERGKKTGGTVPQSMLFDRSVDYEEFDATIHVTGQVLDSINVVKAGIPDGNGDPVWIDSAQYPIIAAEPNSVYSENTGYANVKYPMRKSNYTLKSMTITVSKDNYGNSQITGLSFNEDEHVVHASDEGQRYANYNWQVDRNNVTNTVIKLQQKLGRETTEDWSALGLAIKEPYETASLVHDIEATTGAIMGAAYRACNSCLSYNGNNRIAKDGAQPQRPAVAMFLEGMGVVPNPDVVDLVISRAGSFTKAIFDKSLYRIGSAAGIIAMFDSTTKYKSKSNFLNYPKSLKMWVQKLDNNLNVFHAKKEFLMALDTVHCYSTMDGSYNPMLPIYATDKISITLPLSLNCFAKDFNRKKYGAVNDPYYTQWGTYKNYRIKWKDLRSVYYYGITHPIVDGIARWLVEHEGAFIHTFCEDNMKNGTSVDIVMPCFFSMKNPSLFQFILAAAAQDISLCRIESFRPYNEACDQIGYVFEDLSPLDELNFKFSSNMTLGAYNDPIRMGKLKPASAVHILYPETLTPINGANPSVGTSSAKLLLPFYFSENNVKQEYSERSGFINEENPCGMLCPILRHGVRHEYLDFFYSMKLRDFRLCLDRMTEVPLPVFADPDKDPWINGNKWTPLTISSSNVTFSSLRYDIVSDGRVIALYKNNNTGPKVILNKASKMSTPRELGFILSNDSVQPIMYGLAIDDDLSLGEAIQFGGNYRMSDVVDGSTSFRLKSYSAFGPKSQVGYIIDRSTALMQRWDMYFSDRSGAASVLNARYVERVGSCPSTSYLFSGTGKSLSEYASLIMEYSLGSDSRPSSPQSGVSIGRVRWFTQNRSFKPVDVYQALYGYDVVNPDGTPDVLTKFAPYDPMDACVPYGLSGFLTADYTQDCLNREEEQQELQTFYIKDSFIRDSLIMRAD